MTRPAPDSPADGLDAARLPEGHDDPESPFYVPEQLRADYLPDHRAEADEWLTTGRDAVAAAHVRRQAADAMDAEHIAKTGQPLPERFHLGIVSPPALDAALARLTDDDRDRRAHTLRLAKAQARVAAREQAADAMARATCQVCRDVSPTVLYRDTRAGQVRACRDCADTLDVLALVRAMNAPRPDGTTRRAHATAWLDAR